MPGYVLSLLIFFIVLIVIFYFGPRETVDPKPTIASLPGNIDDYVRQQEAALSDVVPGTEKKIIWHNIDLQQQTEYAIVYLHGFSASRQEVSPLVENLGQKLKANVFMTRLTGHGQSGKEMLNITANALLSDTLEAFEIGKRLGHKLLIIGTSTGATLGTWLAMQKNTQEIFAMILLSPNFGLKNKKSEWLLLPWAKTIVPLIEGKTYHFQPDNELQARFWTWEYPSQALFPMMALVDFVRTQDFSKIVQPIQILYAEEDNVIDVSALKTLYPHFGSKAKQLVAIKGTQGSQHHILAGDIMTPATTNKVQNHILNFLISIGVKIRD